VHRGEAPHEGLSLAQREGLRVGVEEGDAEEAAGDLVMRNTCSDGGMGLHTFARGLQEAQKRANLGRRAFDCLVGCQCIPGAADEGGHVDDGRHPFRAGLEVEVVGRHRPSLSRGV